MVNMTTGIVTDKLKPFHRYLYIFASHMVHTHIYFSAFLPPCACTHLCLSVCTSGEGALTWVCMSDTWLYL